MKESLASTLRQLRLSGLAETLDVRLQEAAGNGLNHEEFLEIIFEDEKAVRKDRLLKRRTKIAAFRDQRTLEDFDWSFNRSIKRPQIYELATCRFLKEATDVLFVGPPGVGKSHLSQAIGNVAIRQNYTVLYRSVFDLIRDFLRDEALSGEERILQRYLKPDLLIIDDMGMKQLPKQTGEYLFEVIMRRHEIRSTMMTTNRPLEDWGKLLQDVPSATAILDRFLERAQIITITGRSYRLRNRAAADEPTPELEPADQPQ